MIALGDVLGNKYRLDRLLGEGGMGAVYAAENLNTGRRVAVKVLHTSLMEHAEAGQRFIREARATTAIAHPNIVEVLDLEADAARKIVYIVQEFLEGLPLDAVLHQRPGNSMTAAEIVAIVVPVMEALTAAHARGIVHRDLKPGNLFLARRGSGEIVPKIIDFGIAKDVAQSNPTHQTREGTMIGTPAYMSPEQVAGRADVDAQTDVWAMGVVLFEMLSGRMPYEAENDNLLMAKVLYEAPTPLAAFAPHAPAGLAAVVDRALQKDRALRFPSMSEMLDATRAASAGEKSVTIPLARPSIAPPLTMAAAPVTMVAPPDTMQAIARSTTKPGEKPPRRRWPLAAALIVILGLVGGAVALSWPRESTPPRTAVPVPAMPPPVPPPAHEAVRTVPALEVAPAPAPEVVPAPTPVARARPMPSTPAGTQRTPPLQRRRRPRRNDPGGTLPNGSTPPRGTVLGAEDM
jgi:serine/threonine-protein kinase